MYDKQPADSTDLDLFLSTRLSAVTSIRLLLMAYWIMDNIDILSKFKILTIDSTSYEKRGKICWLISLGLHFWLDLRIIVKYKYQTEYINKQLEL